MRRRAPESEAAEQLAQLRPGAVKGLDDDRASQAVSAVCTAVWAACAGMYIGMALQAAQPASLGAGGTVPAQYFAQLQHDLAAAKNNAAQLVELAEAGEYGQLRALASNHASSMERLADLQSTVISQVCPVQKAAVAEH